MKNFFVRGASMLMPMVFTALLGAAQVVTDPSDTPGYDQAKMTASRSTASGPGASAQLRASTTATARTGLPDTSAPMAAASSCFIPRDASYTAVARNDDGSFGPLTLPFTFDLYGSSYNQVWINTNGNLTFTGAYSAYSASGFPFTMPMVAGFWGDVDTRNTASGQIYYKLSATNLIVTWDGVGYYSSMADKKNTFQIIIGSATDALLGPASNVSLRYGDMQWTTGSASGGSGGFGGTPATVGVNKGAGSQYVQIGRFGLSGAAYDGPGGATDGVDYLDGQCFGFQVSNAGNIPPSVSGMPSGNTITVACGQTVTVRPQFLAPEVNQTVTVTANANGLCGTNITTTNGATANAAITITGSQCNVGTHTINLSATDNGVPAATTTTTLTVVVTSCCNVQLGAVASAVSCPGGTDGRLDLTVSNATAPISYAWSNGSTAEDPSGLAAGTYTVTVTDANGCTATGSYSVRQEDRVTPTVLARDYTLTLDASGQATLSPANVDNGSTDNCQFGLSLSRTAFSCADLGPNQVTLTGTDAAGHSASATATVTVVDATAPTAVAQGLTVQLDANGAASITAAQIDHGSADNCSVASVTVTPSSFGCANLGSNLVTLTVTDGSGNYSSATATVTVVDATAPAAVAQGLTVQLDAAGQASITAAQVNNGSTDNCGIASLTVSPSAFTCANVGPNTVTLTVTDGSGNVSTAAAVVTVADGIAPTAVAQNLTVQLDASGSASITAAQIDNGSTDNCGVASVTVAPSSFSCANVGANSVTLTVTDVHGNVSTAAATVTVVDAIAPTALAQNVTVQLDANGAASITAAQVDHGSADNCGIASVTVAPSSFGCTNLGSNLVTLTVTDVNGNVSTATATVTVQDNIAPTFSQCPANISVTAQPGDCTPAVSWTAPVAADNCSFTVSSSHQPGARFAVGTTVVMYTVTDRAGNATACSFSVTVTPTPVVVALSSPTYAGGFNIGCYGSSTGAATAAVSGGCQPYRYQWSNGQTSAMATGLAAGTYSVTVTDANNTSVVRSITLTQPGPLALSTSYSPQATFQGANTATIYLGYGQQSLSLSASASGGVAGYTYRWSPATGLSATTGASVTAAPTATTTYTVTATDQNGCTASRSFTVRVVDARCGTKGNPNKVVVCHNGHEICVDDSAVPAHLAHGCYVGPCGSNNASRNATSTPAGSLSQLQVEAAPNPNRGSFGVQVRAASAAPTQADLYDLQGRLVARLFSGALQAGELRELTVQQPTLASGVYIVRVQNGKDVQHVRVVVEK